MRHNSVTTKVGNRPFPLLEVTLNQGDTLEGFLKTFSGWLQEQGSPKFFRVTVNLPTGEQVCQTTIEGMNELVLFMSAFRISHAIGQLK